MHSWIIPSRQLVPQDVYVYIVGTMKWICSKWEVRESGLMFWAVQLRYLLHSQNFSTQRPKHELSLLIQSFVLTQALSMFDVPMLYKSKMVRNDKFSQHMHFSHHLFQCMDVQVAKAANSHNHHFSSFYMRVLWTNNEQILFFVIWKIVPHLLKAWVNN